jgi:hypothetical protein
LQVQSGRVLDVGSEFPDAIEPRDTGVLVPLERL